MDVVEEKIIERRPCPRLIGGNDRLFLFEDILINVLSKLPVKTLLRFKCVCKRWLYLISDDPHFIQLHSQQSNSKQPRIVFQSDPNDPRNDLRGPGPYPRRLISMDMEGNLISRFEGEFNCRFPNLLPTCFDLVCINDGEMIHICNPSTHEFITLPESPVRLLSALVGFGYVQSTDEFKVVCLDPPEDYDDDAPSVTTKCQVFTLGMERRGSSSSSSWAWRGVVDCPCYVHYGHVNPAFVNGTIHWLVIHRSKVPHGGYMVDDHNPYMIIAFDVDSEEFRLISCPNDFHAFFMRELNLVELRGLLCLSCAKDSKMDILMLKDYESGNRIGTWVKEYSIDLNVLDGFYPWDEIVFIIRYVPRHTDDTKMLIEINSIELGYYHLQSTSFEELIHPDDCSIINSSFYMESLRSLKQIQERALKQKQKVTTQEQIVGMP